VAAIRTREKAILWLKKEIGSARRTGESMNILCS